MAGRKLVIIGTGNGLVSVWYQAITRTSVQLFRSNCIESWIKMVNFSYKKMHLNMLPTKYWPFCSGFSVWSWCLINRTVLECWSVYATNSYRNILDKLVNLAIFRCTLDLARQPELMAWCHKTFSKGWKYFHIHYNLFFFSAKPLTSWCWGPPNLDFLKCHGHENHIYQWNVLKFHSKHLGHILKDVYSILWWNHSNVMATSC